MAGRPRSPRPAAAPAAPAARVRVPNPNRVPLAQQTQSGDSFGGPRNQFGGSIFQGQGTLTGAAQRNRAATEARVRTATTNALSGRSGPSTVDGGLRMADVVKSNIAGAIGAGTSSKGG